MYFIIALLTILLTVNLNYFNSLNLNWLAVYIAPYNEVYYLN